MMKVKDLVEKEGLTSFRIHAVEDIPNICKKDTIEYARVGVFSDCEVHAWLFQPLNGQHTILAGKPK